MVSGEIKFYNSHFQTDHRKRRKSLKPTTRKCRHMVVSVYEYCQFNATLVPSFFRKLKCQFNINVAVACRTQFIKKKKNLRTPVQFLDFWLLK